MVAAGLSQNARATDYYVDPAGLGGLGNGTRTFTTPQAAFAAIPAGTAANPTRVLVSPGTYSGQATINKNYVDLIGLGTDSSKTTFTDNLTLTMQNSTFTVAANNFTASNVTFANSTPNGANGHPTIQALAMYNTGDENAFQNCTFTGFQDTLYTGGGRSYFNQCNIIGISDFIYGNSTAVFNNSSIFSPGSPDGTTSAGGHTTAANTAANKPIGFVFMNSTFTGAGINKTDLGRPWQFSTGSYANVMYINDKIGPHIISTMWNPWVQTPANTNPLGDTRYAVFGLTDLNGNPYDVSNAVNYSHNLTAADAAQLTLSNIFGPVSNFSFSHWGVGANTIWGPVNAVGTSGVTTAITATSFTDWSLGGTWNPSLQLATVPEPACVALLSGALLLLGCRAKSGRFAF